MGKASKWFRGLLTLGRAPPSTSSSAPKPPKEKRRWSFVKSYRDNNLPAAISPHECAAVKIQAAFRGCLARKALRALKGLVKLQALVRGHIERKRTAEWMERMQTLLRAQASVLAARPQLVLQRAKSSTAHLHGPATPDIFESPIRSASAKYDQSSSSLKRNGSKSRLQNGNPVKLVNGTGVGADERSHNQRRSWTRTCSMDDERGIRIGSGKPRVNSKPRNLLYSSSQSQPLVSDYYCQSLSSTRDSTSYQSIQSSFSCEVQSYNSPLKIKEVEESSFCCAEDNSSQISASFTPTKSDGSRSYLSNYSDYPSYMAYTESSKAKVRSLSAPKQRPQYERSCSFNRYSHHGFGHVRLAATQRVSSLRESFASKAYPGSARLDNLGLPVGCRY